MTNEYIEKRFNFDLEMGMFKIIQKENCAYFECKYNSYHKWINKFTKVLLKNGYKEIVADENEYKCFYYKCYQDYKSSCNIIKIFMETKEFKLYQKWRVNMFYRYEGMINEIPEYVGYYNHKIEVNSND